MTIEGSAINRGQLNFASEQIDVLETQQSVRFEITRANGKIEASDATTKAIANTTTKEAQFFVAGNCGMCKARIENAIRSLPGIVNASWNTDTKQCEVAFNEEAISLTEIQAKIAEVGHDNKHKKADDAVYETLPGCCKYERITNTKTQN